MCNFCHNVSLISIGLRVSGVYLLVPNVLQSVSSIVPISLSHAPSPSHNVFNNIHLPPNRYLPLPKSSQRHTLRIYSLADARSALQSYKSMVSAPHSVKDWWDGHRAEGFPMCDAQGKTLWDEAVEMVLVRDGCVREE